MYCSFPSYASLAHVYFFQKKYQSITIRQNHYVFVCILELYTGDTFLKKYHQSIII